MVPSLDIVLTVNGRTPHELADEMTVRVLDALFASVLEPYTTCDGRSMNATPVQRVVGFTLINADNDRVIRRLRDGDTLTLAGLPTPRLNVRADVWPDGVGSVLFGLDGVTGYRVESSAPFALAGDRAGNYEPWTPTAGPHTLEAVPYAGAGGSGTAGIRSTLRFTVR